ncbi:MAG: hypothetical protein LWW77_09850 [Propionibacteriales bacterium]|nr:hypothetical protein [Propionibacteriales bacterium]
MRRHRAPPHSDPTEEYLMSKSVPMAALVIGLGAMGMVLYRALSGEVFMPVIVAIGVLGGVGVLVAWMFWDRRIFTSAISRLREAGGWDLLIGGYLVAVEYRNPGTPRPPKGEVVLAAGASGISLYDPRSRSSEPVLVTTWSNLIDLTVGTGHFMNADHPALVMATMEGRVAVVLRGDGKSGLGSAGAERTTELVDRLRHLRPNALFE